MVETQSAIADSPPIVWTAKKLADAARQFEKHRTGRTPKSVTAVMVDGSLVITLRETLSPTEQEMAKTWDGADQLQKSHRRRFRTSWGSLRREVEDITGIAVRAATSEVAARTGTVVLVFRLASNVGISTWSESQNEPTSIDRSYVNGEPALGGEG